MASHVVVVDTTARTARIKTTPGKHLTEVLSEACAKFNVKADNYTLKFNNKPVDLSRTIRLANLPQGAKLDLVQASRSPSVVNVALQLEQPGQRLTHKFPSNTSLWQILRVFETVADKKLNLNLTQRAVAVTSSGTSGAGRLNYEIPVINIMGREMGTFTDLQKTLGQLGFTSSSALLRCSFRDSGKSLEEAMTEISEYFKGVEGPEQAQTKNTKAAPAEDTSKSEPTPEPSTAASAADSTGDAAPAEPTSAMEDVQPTTQQDTPPAPPSKPEIAAALVSATPEAPPPEPVDGPDHRPIQIYTPSSSAVPAAVRNAAFNEEDYIPTIDHAKSHQALLQNAGKNKRLASDAELAAAEQAKADKLAAVEGVTIRVRLPDTSHIEARFTKTEAAADVYQCVRGVLAHGDQPFTLKYSSARGPLVPLKDGPERLVKDLGFQGRQLVNLVWEDGASNEARRQQSLKQEWYAKGHELAVREPVATAPAASGSGQTLGGAAAQPPAKKQVSAEEKESKLKGILGKGLFKKK